MTEWFTTHGWRSTSTALLWGYEHRRPRQVTADRAAVDRHRFAAPRINGGRLDR